MSVRTAERPGHRFTTRHAQAVYPFMAPGGLGGRGVFIGRDAGGGAFCFDPWALYSDGVLDDPSRAPIQRPRPTHCPRGRWRLVVLR